jgi:hypothetical protein
MPRPRFSPGERTPGTHCTGGWVGPRAGMDTEVRGNILCLCRRSNPDSPVTQPVVRHYTAWANPAHTGYCYYCTKRPFSDLLCSQSEFLSIPIYPPEFSALVATESPGESGRNWARNGRWNLSFIISHTSLKLLTCNKILRHGSTALLPLRRK